MKGAKINISNFPWIEAEAQNLLKDFADKLINSSKNEIISIYLIGSYAKNLFIPSSDLDLFIVCSNVINETEIQNIKRNINLYSSIKLDIKFDSLYNLKLKGNFLLKDNGLLIIGEDIKNEIQEMLMSEKISFILEQCKLKIKRFHENLRVGKIEVKNILNILGWISSWILAVVFQVIETSKIIAINKLNEFKNINPFQNIKDLYSDFLNNSPNEKGELDYYNLLKRFFVIEREFLNLVTSHLKGPHPY